MDVHVEEGEIRIKLTKGTGLSRLFVEGALQAEYGLLAHGPQDFQAELGQARAARAACEMMARVLAELTGQGTKPDHMVKAGKRDAAYAAGLEAGLKGEHRVIGTDRMHRIAGSVVSPEHKLNGPSFERGWHLGCAILAAVSLSQGLPDPRRVWEEQAEAAMAYQPEPAQSLINEVAEGKERLGLTDRELEGDS